MPTPKRAVDSDFQAPSRMPMDSAFKNTDQGSEDRAMARTIEELRKEAKNLVFTQKRAEGYSKERSSQDLVEDVNPLNTDQKQRDGQAYLRDEGVQASRGTLPSGKAITAKQEADAAYEAAKRALVEAEGGSATYQAALIAELYEAHPQLRMLDRDQLTSHPAKKLADLYNKSLNEGRLSTRQTSAKSWQERYEK